MKIISIIPARGGSKGLPKKNILELAGKPLIAWTIESSLKSKYISKTIVSSDCDEILNISSKYATDTTIKAEILKSLTEDELHEIEVFAEKNGLKVNKLIIRICSDSSFSCLLVPW